jgi:hypothetical protein
LVLDFARRRWFACIKWCLAGPALVRCLAEDLGAEILGPSGLCNSGSSRLSQHQFGADLPKSAILSAMGMLRQLGLNEQGKITGGTPMPLDNLDERETESDRVALDLKDSHEFEHLHPINLHIECRGRRTRLAILIGNVSVDI